MEVAPIHESQETPISSVTEFVWRCLSGKSEREWPWLVLEQQRGKKAFRCAATSDAQSYNKWFKPISVPNWGMSSPWLTNGSITSLKYVGVLATISSFRISVSQKQEQLLVFPEAEDWIQGLVQAKQPPPPGYTPTFTSLTSCIQFLPGSKYFWTNYSLFLQLCFLTL